MLKRFLKAEKQFRTVHSAYRNVDFRLVDSKPTDLANRKREIDLLSKIKQRSKEIEDVERIKNELRPRTEAIFSLQDEALPLTKEDFDEDGNLKPFPSDEQKQELYLGARRVLSKTFRNTYEPIPEEFWKKYRRPLSGAERKLTHLEQIRFDFTKSQFQNELKSLRMEYGTIDWDAEYWIEAVAQYDTRMVWNNIGRTADGKPKSTISFTELDGVRIPRGYYNYSTHSVETLPEQNILNLVGYDFLSPFDSSSELPLDVEGLKADIELVKNNLRQLYISNEITRLPRSQIAIQCSHPRYLEAVEALQSNWSEILQRPIEEIKEIQNVLVDSTDLSFMDVDYLFQKNWEKADFLLDIPAEAILESLQTLKVDTGITFGCDLGATLRNCPELMTLEPEIAFDRKKSFIGWGFEGHNLGNIIRYSPNAFLDDNADTTEIKIQYMMMRTGADYEIVSESGLLELDPIEMAAKFEFLYRRGITNRPTRKDYRREKKKWTKFEVEAKQKEMAEHLRQTYATNLQDFCKYAKCELVEFEMFCSLFAKEIEDCDGLATRDFHVLMGMKIPFRLDDRIVANYKNRRQPTYNLVNKAFRGTREHGIQFVWYQNEDENQPGRSLLYEELAKDHNLNKLGDHITLNNSEYVDDSRPDRFEKQYVKITHAHAAKLLQSGH